MSDATFLLGEGWTHGELSLREVPLGQNAKHWHPSFVKGAIKAFYAREAIKLDAYNYYPVVYTMFMPTIFNYYSWGWSFWDWFPFWHYCLWKNSQLYSFFGISLR